MPDAFTADALFRTTIRRIVPVFCAFILLLLTAMVLASCTTHPSKPTVPVPLARNGAPLPVTAAPAFPAASDATRQHRIGTVRVIGSGQRFVLIEVPSPGAGALPDGQILRCLPAGAADTTATATLRVARERRRPFIVADVATGEPHVGDEVFVVSSPSPAPGTSMVLPTATAGVLPIILPAPRANP